MPKMKPFVEGRRPPDIAGERSFYNGKYQVILKRGLDGLTILAVRREDRKPILDWRDVQWIKNQLLGPEVEAVQLFPAESRLVDTANQYYLYAYPKGYRFPFGFTERLVSESVSITIGPDHGASVQRPFGEHVRPDDLEENHARIGEELKTMGFRRS